MDDSDQIPETEALENSRSVADDGNVPQQIDRYRVERLLGEGGFGCVYLARDDLRTLLDCHGRP